MAAAGYTTREVARLVNLPESRVRSYARAGLVGVRDRFFAYDFRDLMVLRMAARLLGEGLAPVRVQRALKAMRKQMLPATPLSGAQLSLDAGRVIASDGSIRWDPESGQCLLRFAARRLPASHSDESLTMLPQQPQPVAPAAPADVIAALGELGPVADADRWFDEALAVEEGDPSRAYGLYLKALACDPEHVEATINIGRLCSASGDAQRSAAYFRQATRRDPAHPVAHFNLAVTLHDLGDTDGAMDAYRDALLHDPHFADAHFNLATLLDQRGEAEEAIRHFAAYRKVSRDT